MENYPIKERLLFESLPGFEQLSEDEKERIILVKFEYRDHTLFYSCDLTFYYDRNQLVFRLLGRHDTGYWFSYIQYLLIDDLEFPNFREAIDYFKKTKNKHDYESMAS